MLAQLFALLPLLALTSAGPIAKRDGTLIRAGRDGQCLALEGLPGVQRYGLVQNGTPVITRDCLGANTWFINRGSGSITIPGTNFALDIGLTPGNNGALKVWQSYPGATQQTWYLTDDNRIAQTGGNQCLDEGDNGVQTYECTTGNTNQIWYIDGSNTPTPSASTSSAGPSASTTPPPPATILPKTPIYSNVIPDTPGAGQRIRPVGRAELCSSVDGVVADGSTVILKYCTEDGQGAALQVWDLPSGTGQVRLHGTNFCLDAGENPANGVGAKIWTCYDVPQQQFTYANNKLKTANNQCFNIQKESDGLITNKPFNTVARLQTWECSTNGDPYQAFGTSP